MQKIKHLKVHKHEYSFSNSDGQVNVAVHKKRTSCFELPLISPTLNDAWTSRTAALNDESSLSEDCLNDSYYNFSLLLI